VIVALSADEEPDPIELPSFGVCVWTESTGDPFTVVPPPVISGLWLSADVDVIVSEGLTGSDAVVVSVS
jgi:hypothetical protein